MNTDESGLNDLQVDAAKAKAALEAAVAEACPGDHKPTQHRDRLPPWCRHCGRDAEGVQRHVVVKPLPDEDVHDWMRRKLAAELDLGTTPARPVHPATSEGANT